MIMMPHIAPLPLSLRWMLSGKLYTTPTVLSSGEALKKTNSVRVLSSFAPLPAGQDQDAASAGRDYFTVHDGAPLQ